MRVLVASDKWRGSFTSAAAGEALAAGVRRARPEADVRILPVADGGEGTLDVVLAASGGSRRETPAADPLGRTIPAAWGILEGGRALVESAAAVGLDRLREEERDPLATSSRGVGDLVRAALDAGCRDVVLALGGSATVDAGAGMARALGYRLLDDGGEPLGEGGGALADLASIDPSEVDRRLHGLTVEAWCDVVSPLPGAARVFGPQKGADEEEVEKLERGLARFLEVAARDLGADGIGGLPGAGAAGGLGAGAAAFLGARLASGPGRVLEAIGIEGALQGIDLVLTGEGRYEPETMPGKLPDVVLARAAARGIPAAVICGEAGEGATGGAVPVLSRTDLIDNRGWELGPADLAELAGMALCRFSTFPRITPR